MKSKSYLALVVAFSFWTNIFTPFLPGQNLQLPNQQKTGGLQFRISEVVEKGAPQTAKTSPRIEELSRSETDAILQKLPPMFSDPNDETNFKLSSDSLKPPRSGKIIPLKLPNEKSGKVPKSPAVTAQNLEVERVSPKGDVKIVTDLSIKFSQPRQSRASCRVGESDRCTRHDQRGNSCKECDFKRCSRQKSFVGGA